MSEIPKPPTISSIWGYIESKHRDQVATMFLTWLIRSVDSVKDRTDAGVLGNLVHYHLDDIVAVMKQIAREPFRKDIDYIVKIILGVE